MGRPLNSRYFGTSTEDAEIKVQFHNGTSSVDGYIVKQLASRRFRCTDGSNTADCKLVDKAAGSLAEGEMSISVKDDTGTVKQVTKIAAHKLTLDTGESIKWNFSESTTDGNVEMEETGGHVVGDVISIADAEAEDGKVYRIVDLGDTTWASYDAAGDQSPYSVGDTFTMANAPGTGTGTVEEYNEEDTFGT